MSLKVSSHIPTASSMPVSASPDIAGKTSASVASVASCFDFTKILKLPKELQAQIVAWVPDDKVALFESALGKGSKLDKTLKPSFTRFHAHVERVIHFRSDLTKMLKKYPQFVPIVKLWKNVSMEDQLWFLGVYEFIDLQKKTLDPMEMPELLKQKEEINSELAKVISWDLSGRGLTQLPNCIRLLPNLEVLDLSDNALTTPPNFTKNPKLRILSINQSELNSPPIFGENTAIEEIYLNGNCLGDFPVLPERNRLKKLEMGDNQLIRSWLGLQAPGLEYLDISDNFFITSPHVDKYPKLKHLLVSRCQMVVAPDVTKLPDLEVFMLNDNQIRRFPHVTRNRKLRILSIYNNPIVDSKPHNATTAVQIRKLKKGLSNLAVITEAE